MARRNDDDYFDDGDDDGPEPDGGPQTPQEFAALRRSKRIARDNEARAVKAERALAFVRAGIDPDQEGIGAYFVKGYEGDLDPAKIKEAALAAGVIAPPPPDPQAQAQAEAQEAALSSQQRISGAATAAQAAPTPTEQDRTLLIEAMKTGGPDALAAALAAQGIPIAEY